MPIQIDRGIGLCVKLFCRTSIVSQMICYTLTRIENVLIYAPFFFVLLRKNIMLPAGDRYYQLINVFIRKKAKVREFFSRYHMIFIFFLQKLCFKGGD